MRATLVSIAAAALLVACSQDSIPDQSAEVTIEGSTTTFSLEACGVDQETLLIVGIDGEGAVLQVAVGVVADGDGYVVVEEEVGFSVEHAGGTLAAFTPLAWRLSGGDGNAPGGVFSARLRGSRLSLSARAQVIDGAGASSVDVQVTARCDGDEVA